MSASYNHFICRTYKKDGEACTGHYIRECVLDEIVLEDLRRRARRGNIPEKFAAYIGSKQSAELQREIRRQEKELQPCGKRKAELDAIFKSCMRTVCWAASQQSSSDALRQLRKNRTSSLSESAERDGHPTPARNGERDGRFPR